MSLTPEQIRLREYLQDCVNEVRSKKYIPALVEELGYLQKHIKNIAYCIQVYGDYHDDYKNVSIVIGEREGKQRDP